MGWQTFSRAKRQKHLCHLVQATNLEKAAGEVGQEAPALALLVPLVLLVLKQEYKGGFEYWVLFE